MQLRHGREVRAAPRVILRCRLPRRGDRTRYCGGLIGGVPDGAEVIGLVLRVEDAPGDCFALRCDRCERIVVVAPPMEKAA